VVGHQEFGLQLFLVPVYFGKTVYYSYLITSKASKINNFLDLQNKAFAFSDPLSNSGYFYPAYLLAKINQTPETFFSKFIFTYSHDNSLQAVLDGIVDGAAVDSLIYDYELSLNPNLIYKIKIIKKSPPFGMFY